MLEWVTSKVVVSIAALLILASVGGFIVAQREGWKEQQASNISRNVAKLVNQVSTVNSNLTTVIHFGDDSKGLTLPSNIDGAQYILTFDRTGVRCELDGRSKTSEFYTGIHLFSPFEIDPKNQTLRRALDLEHQTLTMHSTGKIVLIRAPVTSSGIVEYDTFLFTGG